MGFLDRLHKIATGIGGSVQAVPGLVKDLATAPWEDDDEFDGFFHTLIGRTEARLGQGLGNMFGPEEGLGAALGALPAGVRNPARSVINPVLGGLETAYREGVSEPLSTALTVGSLSDRPGGGGIGGLFSSSNWREGYRLAQHRSPGQAFALAVLTKDVTDENEVTKAAGTDGYKALSGTWDAVTRWYLDPAVVAGHAITLGRTELYTRPVRALDDIDQITQSRSFNRFLDETEGMGAAQIRDRFFSDHPQGAAVSTILAEAGDRTTREQIVRTLMGDPRGAEAIAASRGEIGSQLARVLDDSMAARSAAGDLEVLPAFGTAVEDRLSALAAEVDTLYDADRRLARVEANVGSIREAPRATVIDRARSGLTRSDWYQSSPFAAPLRVTFNMQPHSLVNLHDTTGDIQIRRMLSKSALEVDAQEGLRSRYMAAFDPGERQRVLIEAEEAAVRSVAEKAGMTVGDIDKVLQQAAAGRGRAADVLKSRVYDGEGRSLLRFADEGGVAHELPLLVSQEANILPLVDMDAVNKAATSWGQFRARHPNVDIPRDMAEKFYRVWKPSALLRVGWPLRVVGDEQLRIIAKIGALAQFKNLRTTIGTKVHDIVMRIPEEERLLNRAGVEINGVRLQGPFGAPGDGQNVYNELTKSRASFDASIGRHEEALREELRQSTGEWRSIAPEHQDYGGAWENAVNHQIGSDQMARQFLKGSSVDDVAAWLESTPEGLAYSKRLPYRRDKRAWAETVQEQVESYTAGSDVLKQAALRRRATAADLASVVPDASLRPVVHGEILNATMGKSSLDQAFNKVVSGAFRALGQVPSDALSRHPFFSTMYKAEAERRVTLAQSAGQALDEPLLHQIENSAREYALGETKSLLYDLAEGSELGQMLRFLMPFYGAWQEVLTRWAGLAVENPAFMAHARQVWNAPDKAGLVYTEPQSGEEYIRLRVPDMVKDWPGMKGLTEVGQVTFAKNSFNLALQGAPGFGPLVQIPVNEVVKQRPDLESALKFVLPYGTTQNLSDLIMPATARRLRTRMGGEEDRVYRNQLMRIYWDKVTDYNLGKREKPPTYAEAKKETDALYNLRTVASFVMPAAPSFQSPYQMYIDKYRALRDKDPMTADDKFLEQFGPEYFALTQSLSKSMDGVPPTVEAYAARSKYRELIEQHPELGGLIVGQDGAGEFSRAVYDSQLASRLRPGSGEKQRQAFSFEEAAAAPNVRLGWNEFGKAMDLIDAARVARGLPNLQVKAAQDLSLLKRGIIEGIARKYPQWFAEYSQTDELKWQKRITGLRAIADDNRLAQRDDIQGLRDYLKLRDLFSGILQARESNTLTASSNQDLSMLWHTITGSMVERNLPFGALYHRYLERNLPSGAHEVELGDVA